MNFDLKWVAISVFTMLLTNILCNYYISVLTEIKSFKKSTLFIIVTTISSSMLSYSEHFYPNNSYIAIAKALNALIICSLLIKLIYKIKLIRSLSYNFIFVFILAFSNSIVLYIQSLLGFEYISTELDFKTNVVGHFLVCIIIFVNILILKQIITSYQIIKKFPNKIKSKSFVVNIVFMITIFIFILMNMIFLKNAPELGVIKELFFSNLFVIISSITITIYNLVLMGNLEHTSSELENQKFYNKTLQNFIDDVKSFRHNYNNLLSVMSGYKSLERWEQLSRVIDEEIKKSNVSFVYDTILASGINNAALIGLISAKMKYALEHGIHISIFKDGNLDEINANMNLFCEIFGILLDNAIEAASETSTKIVRLTIDSNNSEISFNIENSFAGIIDIDKIFNKGESTKGKEHGMGLWIVKNRLKNNKKIKLNTSINKTIFKQELVVK